MKLSKNKVSEYWDTVREKYTNFWISGSKIWMSQVEGEFIKRNASKVNAKSPECLDVGSGNGRIVDFLLDSGFKKICSTDISLEMVGFLKNKYKGDSRIKSISKIQSINDIKGNYDLITAIRVLKYNSDWKDNLKHLVEILEPGGYIIFTIPNQLSINVFAKCPIKIYRISINNLKKYLSGLPVEVVEIESKFRLPDILYWSKFLAKINLVSVVEVILSRVFPKTFGGKIFFVSIKKIQ